VRAILEIGIQLGIYIAGVLEAP